MGILLRNWQLKLAAVAVATILYTGLVFSGSFSEQDLGGVPVEALNQPPDSVTLSGIPVDVRIRYRVAAQSAGRVGPDSFLARVDLATYDMARAGDPQSLRVDVRAVADDVAVLSWEPRQVTVTLDRFSAKRVPVEVDPGDLPAGLEAGRPDLSLDEVEARGPESLLRRVDRAVARVRIDPSGIDVSDPIQLLPVDLEGRLVDGVELDPATVTVEIDVESVQTSKTVPVRPVVAGVVAPGFALGALTVEPATVTLDGPPDVLAAVADVPTEALTLDAATETIVGERALVLPEGVAVPDDAAAVTGTAEVVALEVARTLLTGVRCDAAPSGTSCLPETGQLAVTVRGATTAVNGIDAAGVVVAVDATGLPPGQHDLQPSIAGLPEGVELVSVSPGVVRVTIERLATPSPTPSPGG
jgi:YbbR domain-containing protein